MTCKCSNNSSDDSFTSVLNLLSWSIADKAVDHFLHDYEVRKLSEGEQKVLFVIAVHDILSRQSCETLEQLCNKQDVSEIDEGAAPI